ncbi:MAG: RHS repeat-associated core domain-containing protein [Phycisphaeraceae bacterium]|nr:RHS repeat-associated core domain-containing protein [Phycisphaeraceae bacterium]
MSDWSDDANNTSDYDNRVLYAGYRLDSETGLYHVRFRDYHPGIGRWLQRDPLGYIDGMGLQEYVGSSPTQFLDGYGLATVKNFDGDNWRTPAVVDIDHAPGGYADFRTKNPSLPEHPGPHMHNQSGNRKYFPDSNVFLDTKTNTWSSGSTKQAKEFEKKGGAYRNWRQANNARVEEAREQARRRGAGGAAIIAGGLILAGIVCDEATGENQRMVDEISVDLKLWRKNVAEGKGDLVGPAAHIADNLNKLMKNDKAGQAVLPHLLEPSAEAMQEIRDAAREDEEFPNLPTPRESDEDEYYYEGNIFDPNPLMMMEYYYGG